MKLTPWWPAAATKALAALAVFSAVAGCAGPTAHAPGAPATTGSTAARSDIAAAPAPQRCTDLTQAITRAEQEADAAAERKAGAWKLVVPFAVLARRVQAGRELEAAEERQAALRAQSAAQGCGSAS